MAADGTLRFADNAALARYEARLEDGTLVGYCDYAIDGDRMVLPYTETLPAYRGRGYADRLVAHVIADARRRNLTPLPRCWFVRDYMRAHPDA